jgi:hypothetical protein
MLRIRQDKKKVFNTGQSMLEYVVLIMLLLGAFLIFQKYITQALSGRWKSIGESMSQGRLYSVDHTTECAYDQVHLNQWYNFTCFKESKCAKPCYSIAVQVDPVPCQTCITSCFTFLCDD